MAAMNFFTSELKKIADRCEFVGDPKYVGRACVFRLSDDVTGKMEFVTEGIADHYSALKMTLFNRKEGVIDMQKIKLEDVIGNIRVGGEIRMPHIWIDRNPMPLNRAAISVLPWILVIQWPTIVSNPTSPQREHRHCPPTLQCLLQWFLPHLPNQYCLQIQIKNPIYTLKPKINKNEQKNQSV